MEGLTTRLLCFGRLYNSASLLRSILMRSEVEQLWIDFRELRV